MALKTIGTDPVQVFNRSIYGTAPPKYTVANYDLKHTLYYSDSPGSINVESSQIGPLNSETFDGTRDMWASTLTGTPVTIDFKPGSIAWNVSPVQTAEQILANGVMLLTGDSLLLDTTQTIAASGTYTSMVLPVSQVGYEISVGISYPGSPPVPFARCVLTWIDSATGAIIDTDTFICTGATAASFITKSHGQTKANSVQVTLTNVDAGEIATAVIIMYQNSRTYTTDNPHWVNSVDHPLSVDSYTLPNLPSDESCLGWVNTSILAGFSAGRLCGMHNGKIGVSLSGGTFSLTLTHVPSTDYGVPAANILLSQTSPPPYQEIIAGRAPIFAVITNNGVSTATASFSLFALES